MLFFLFVVVAILFVVGATAPHHPRRLAPYGWDRNRRDYITVTPDAELGVGLGSAGTWGTREVLALHQLQATLALVDALRDEGSGG